ncbi:hypothetical protein GCM10010249_17110 [Streptomyces roseolilacinus]|uniref:HTH luxR-type domain-containing protein n=1 Tax=Streptomyces roseolilacinus TaxID=66904 RepID=A0A918AXQ1_9ACTN|nr:hypothetical protein GCM10010249_17110 [Streptomyces roseolilacinus]
MTSSRACPISEDDLKLLTLLVTYPSDDPIARHLDVSVRTVRRRIARIMEMLGVQNRFAAGVAAAQLGWVSCAPTARQPAGVRVFSTLPARSERTVVSVGSRN